MSPPMAISNIKHPVVLRYGLPLPGETGSLRSQRDLGSSTVQHEASLHLQHHPSIDPDDGPSGAKTLTEHLAGSWLGPCLSRAPPAVVWRARSPMPRRLTNATERRGSSSSPTSDRRRRGTHRCPHPFTQQRQADERDRRPGFPHRRPDQGFPRTGHQDASKESTHRELVAVVRAATPQLKKTPVALARLYVRRIDSAERAELEMRPATRWRNDPASRAAAGR